MVLTVLCLIPAWRSRLNSSSLSTLTKYRVIKSGGKMDCYTILRK